MLSHIPRVSINVYIGSGELLQQTYKKTYILTVKTTLDVVTHT